MTEESRGGYKFTMYDVQFTMETLRWPGWEIAVFIKTEAKSKREFWDGRHGLLAPAPIRHPKQTHLILM